MSNALAIIGYIAGIFGIVAVVASAFVVFKSNAAKATIEMQNENIKALFDKQRIQEQEIQELREQNLNLQAQLDVFKSVPLTQIAATQEETHSIITQGAKLIQTLADNQQLIMKHMDVRTS